MIFVVSLGNSPENNFVRARADLGVKYKFCMLFNGKRKTLPKTFLEALHV